jgi:hypothetical protein
MRTPAAAAGPVLALSAALCAAGWGCRYQAAGALPEGLRTVGVTMLRNETRFPGLEAEVTRQVITALNSDGRLTVVPAEGEPDLLLAGRVVSYVRKSVRTDRYGDPAAFNVVIAARVSARRAEGGFLFKNLRVTSRDADPESGSVDLGRGQSERRGRERAVRDLGRNVARSLVEQGW